jgi:hypothetical protein
MENYKSISNLVEEIRGILDLTEAGDPDKGIKGKFKGGTKHNPFKRLKKGKSLGPGPKGSTAVPGKKRGYWRCRCMSYKCLCRGTEGEKKVVMIKKGYKNTYNKLYRKWRKTHASRYAPGKGTQFKSMKKGAENA